MHIERLESIHKLLADADAYLNLNLVRKAVGAREPGLALLEKAEFDLDGARCSIGAVINHLEKIRDES